MKNFIFIALCCLLIAETDAQLIKKNLLINLTNGYVPYRVSAATGLANSPIQTDGSNVGIGGAIYPDIRLNIRGSIVGAADAYGIYMGFLTLTPNTGNNAYFQSVGGGTVATGASNTVVSATGLYVEVIAKSGTGTITNSYGLVVNQSSCATNNYGAIINGDLRVIGNYSYLNGLKINGTDDYNTIHNGNNPIAITTNGAIIKLSSSTSGNDLLITTSGNTELSGNLTTTQLKLSALNTAPANATDTGTLGEIRIVNGYIYICVATNTWQRAAILTW